MRTSTILRARSAARFFTFAAIGLSATSVWAAESLPVGIVSESTLVTLLLRIAAVAWGAVLLIAGIRRPVAALMTFYLAVGLAIGLVAVGEKSYLLAIGIALAVVVAASAMVTWLRRMATAAACLWPLPAAYGLHLYFSGSFERSVPLAIVLAAFGAALGGLWPRGGSALLAASLGSILVLTGFPGDVSVWLIFEVAAGSLMWQLLLLDQVWKSPFDDIPSWPEHERRLPRKFTAILSRSAAALAILMVSVVASAPQYGPGAGPNPRRVNRLIENGSLAHSAVVVSPGDNLYLSGRSTPVAILAPEPGFLSRLSLPLTGRSVSQAIHELRAVKEPDELAKMRRAAAITSQAFVDIEPLIRPGRNESEIDKAIIDSFRRQGATGIAFHSVVGSGGNATLPHYDKNDAVMQDGFVVIDIGCSVDGYASDMARTFPVAGTMNLQQRELVDTVNSAGDAARSLLRAGATMGELDRAARQVIEEAGFGPFFLHGLGHHVGLDVHDPDANVLEAGMVITIEPGIYISEGSDVDPAYWNLGLRIEDSYIVTEDGFEEITSFPR